MLFFTHLWSHAAECITGISKSDMPGICGHDISFNVPRALMTTSASSTKISPVSVFSTVTFLRYDDQQDVISPCSCDIPFRSLVIPHCRQNFMRALNESVHREPLHHILQVPSNLMCGRVEAAPVWVWSEGILVGMCFIFVSFAAPGFTSDTIYSHGISQAQPGYLFSYHVPPTPAFFS